MIPAVAFSAVNAGLSLLPVSMDSLRARVMLLAIGMQESRFLHRRQMNNGPATGFWQFERGGGAYGIMRHTSSDVLARECCMARGVEPTFGALWAALERDDALAGAAARLLLYTDPRPLPAVSDAAGAWEYYLRNWRPGIPHPETWAGFHASAVEAINRMGA